MDVQAIRVVCARYGHTQERVATFVRDGDTWGGMVTETDPEPLVEEGRYRWSLRCPSCATNAPAAGMTKLGPILDRLAIAGEPYVSPISSTMVEIPLKLIADALGRSGNSSR